MKTMFDVYSKDAQNITDLAVKMQGYTNFEFIANNTNENPYTKMAVGQLELERLKSTPCDPAPPNMFSFIDHLESKKQESRTEQHLRDEAIYANILSKIAENANRRAFDEIAYKELNFITSTPNKESARRNAIFWCHQQAALLSPQMGLLNTMDSIGIEGLSLYLFKVFFPDLVKNSEIK